MITACIVLLPGMEPVLDCLLQSLKRNSTLITKVLVAVRTQEKINRIHIDGQLQIETFSFWFDLGPTPAGNTHWKGRGYSHAVGLHHCLNRVITDYVLLTEPDVVFLKKNFDQLFLNAIQNHNVSIVGVTRAADPRGQTLFLQQAIGDFPTVIACLMKRASLPPPTFLQGQLKLRPHAFPHANIDENSYELLDGAWLLQSGIPELSKEFPNPEGEYPVGCNLYLWYKDKKYLSFHYRPDYKCKQICNSTTYNLNNFRLANDYYGEEPLLFHSGHGGYEKLKECLRLMEETVNIEYVTNLDHTLKTILIRQWPHRSPYIYTEVVKDFIKDKIVCDIGCGEGDQLAMFSKYAKEVIGVELDLNRAKPAIDRGFEVIIGNYKETGIPIADVYFSWIGIEEDTLFVENLAKIGRQVTSLLFCRKGNHVKSIVEKWGGRLLEFDYREPCSDILGFDKEGKGWAGVIELNRGRH